jgi:hypothetical protein
VDRVRTVSGEVLVAATAGSLYALVSDPSLVRRWSPENTGASTTGSLPVGAEFDGTNRRGRTRWVTRSVVTETWTDDRRWPDALVRAFDTVATGTTFAAFQRGNIRRTLDRLKADAEQG